MTERTSREHAEAIRAMSTERFTGYQNAVERLTRDYIALLDEVERYREALHRIRGVAWHDTNDADVVARLHNLANQALNGAGDAWREGE